MSELVIALPSDIVKDIYDEYGDRAYVWDNVAIADDERDIVALFLTSGPFPVGVEAFHFADTDDATDEAWRLNKALGLTDDEIVDRTLEVLEREKAAGFAPNLIMPDDVPELAKKFDEKKVRH